MSSTEIYSASGWALCLLTVFWEWIARSICYRLTYTQHTWSLCLKRVKLRIYKVLQLVYLIQRFYFILWEIKFGIWVLEISFTYYLAIFIKGSKSCIVFCIIIQTYFKYVHSYLYICYDCFNTSTVGTIRIDLRNSLWSSKDNF